MSRFQNCSQKAITSVIWFIIIHDIILRNTSELTKPLIVAQLRLIPLLEMNVAKAKKWMFRVQEDIEVHDLDLTGPNNRVAWSFQFVSNSWLPGRTLLWRIFPFPLQTFHTFLVCFLSVIISFIYIYFFYFILRFILRACTQLSEMLERGSFKCSKDVLRHFFMYKMSRHFGQRIETHRMTVVQLFFFNTNFRLIIIGHTRQITAYNFFSFFTKNGRVGYVSNTNWGPENSLIIRMRETFEFFLSSPSFYHYVWQKIVIFQKSGPLQENLDAFFHWYIMLLDAVESFMDFFGGSYFTIVIIIKS